MTEQNSPSSEFFPEIRRARLSQLTIYEISESELEILEHGSPNSLYLNFSIFLISSAVSFTIALFTTTMSNTNIFAIFVVFTVVSYIIGIFLFLLWLRNHTSVTKCAESIRKRLPPEGVQQSLENVEEKL